MFNKLSFEELSRFYGALSELENHYGKEAVHNAVNKMSNQLDQHPVVTLDKTLTKKEPDVIVPAEQIKMDLPFGDIPEETEPEEKPKKKRKKRTKQRVIAEEIAGATNETLEEWLIEHYYVMGLTQYQIADILQVNQRTISIWIREIPKQMIQRIVGKRR